MFSAKGIGNKGTSIHEFTGSRKGKLPTSHYYTYSTQAHLQLHNITFGVC